jgi:hypothetical protein
LYLQAFLNLVRQHLYIEMFISIYLVMLSSANHALCFKLRYNCCCFSVCTLLHPILITSCDRVKWVPSVDMSNIALMVKYNKIIFLLFPKLQIIKRRIDILRNVSYRNIFSFFRFVNKRASYPFGIISLAHAPLNVTDFSIGSINYVRHFPQTIR